MIPNTLRRCAAVVGILAVSPLVLFAVYALWLRPIDPAVLVRYLKFVCPSLALAVVPLGRSIERSGDRLAMFARRWNVLRSC